MLSLVTVVLLGASAGQPGAVLPRPATPGYGAGLPERARPISGLTADEEEMFEVGLEDFSEEEGVE